MNFNEIVLLDKMQAKEKGVHIVDFASFIGMA